MVRRDRPDPRGGSGLDPGSQFRHGGRLRALSAPGRAEAGAQEACGGLIELTMPELRNGTFAADAREGVYAASDA
jgi:hypothetical protein